MRKKEVMSTFKDSSLQKVISNCEQIERQIKELSYLPPDEALKSDPFKQYETISFTVENY